MKKKRNRRKREKGNRGKIKGRIITVLSDRRGRSMTVGQIFKVIGDPSLDEGTFNSTMADLIREGRVRITGKKRVSIVPPSVRLRGKLQVHPSGYGFVTIDGIDRDIYIPRSKIGNAFHNDLVEITLDKERMGRRSSGEITEVIEKGMRKVIGTIIREKNGYGLKVEDKKFSYTFDIFSDDMKRLRAGDIVEGTIEGKSGKRKRRGSRIIQKICPKPNVEAITLSTVYQYGMEKEFGKKTVREVSSFSKHVRRNVQGRVDLTEYPFITIDGDDARDFDDAVCLVKMGENYRLLVSIADVSEYVSCDSPTDREAIYRGTSVYFPDRVIPMLPERLSADLCSLREKVNRLTITADIVVNAEGDVIDVDFYRSVIMSKKRLTYEQVQMFLDGDRPIRLQNELAGMLLMMGELASVLHDKRMREGSLDFDLPESDIRLSFRGELEKVARGERHLSHRIIEEFMLLANVLVAKYLAGKKVQFLYRIHEKPDPIKLKGFFTFAANFDSDLIGAISFEDGFLQNVLDSIKDKPYEKILNLVLLRSFKLAKYTPVNMGHFGLGFTHYTHFTSPIRRYPDLMVHRVLKFILGDHTYGTHMNKISGQLDRIGSHLSQRERYSEQAERDVIDKLKALYMVDHVGDEFSGLITSVQPFGCFIELDEIFVEGLIHMNDLPEDIYYLDEDGFTLTGKVYGHTFSVGDRVLIRVKESVPFKGRVDFLLVEKGEQNK